MFVCILCIMCLSLWVCVFPLYLCCFWAHGHTNCLFAQIWLAQLTAFGHQAWLPFCKHNQAKMYTLNPIIHTNTHTMLHGILLQKACQCSPKPCWHTQCLDKKCAFFHGLFYQFNQEIKNKLDFCAAVFVFDKWFILRKVRSRPCPQYLFQAVA